MGSGADTSREAFGLLLLVCGFSRAFCIKIQVDSEVHGIVGQHVKLRCNFWSSSPISEHLTVDWTYKPHHGGPTQNILHYQSVAFPVAGGIFGNRITWEGDISSNDASIAIRDLTPNDNGTFTCTVKNPPDVQSNLLPTVLMVTEQATLLSIMVFAPSVLVVVLLLLRMQRKRRSSNKYSIEIINETNRHRKLTCMERISECCAKCAEDSDEEYDNFRKSVSNITIVKATSYS
ncbi:myelin protein zero-like protein 3 isoform X2 [Microcaecilia unicolor]|uniref:Myelin protein P0 n=1 Tax=Microcaecilia unicolor TaxID=1415580 RepID=A0A6P7ZS04_9AMPH|nr:myelin protein zero-like protein 3 isoform X2 [Microcaecilia unicolor]